MIRSMIRNKKSQAESIIIFFALAVAIFITAIIILRITNAFITPFSAQIGNITTQAGEAVTYSQGRFTAVWDWAIVLFFLFNLMVLLISSFMVDIHPAFLIVYIIAVVLMFTFGNYALYALDSIWGSVGTATETAQTPITQFLINNFQMIMIGIVVLSGVVMYGKFKFFGGQGTGGNS